MTIAKPIILYDNRLLDGTPAATDTATGYDVANITDLRPFTWWQAGSHGTKYITVDCGAEKTADSLAINGHNLFTASATVSVESSATGVWGGEETVRLAGFSPATDYALLKTFTSADAQYWRIKIVTAAVAPRIAVCLLGERLDMEKQVQREYDPTPRKVNAESARSKAGHLIGVTIQNFSFELSANFPNISDSWARGAFQSAWDAHLSLCKPFFWSWNPTSYPADVLFVAIKPSFTLTMPYSFTRRSLRLTMQGVRE